MKNWIFLCLASTNFALLPPLAQSTAELKALLNDPRLYEFLGSAESIREIIRTERGYLVITANYMMQVNIEYERGVMKIGPAQFEFDFQIPSARSFP